MCRLFMVLAMSVTLALLAGGCGAADEPIPVATATPDIGAMVQAAISAALNGTATPTVTPASRPTYTPFPMPTLRPTDTPIVATLVPTPTPDAPASRPTYTPFPMPRLHPTDTPIVATLVPTPMPERLPTVECSHPCDWDYEPTRDYVEWVRLPSVSSTGVLTLLARVDVGIDLIFPNEVGGRYSNIALTSSSYDLLGSVVPPSRPGWHWTPEPGLWVASEYRYFNNTLLVRAQIDPAVATHPGVRLCLWSGGETDEQNQVLDCKMVQQPD